MASAWLDVTSHAFSVGAQYWQGAIARGATPADVLDDAYTWMRLTQNRSDPTWGSPSTVLTESPVARLRDFSPEGASALVPTLILPPQAGHHSCIVDFNPHQSQVGVGLDNGLDRMFVLEWLEATPATAHCSVEEYVGAVRDAVEHIGGPVHLIGDCQGGWLAAIYAALEPSSVATLTVGASPIDFSAGEGPLNDYVALMSNLHVSPYQAMVDAGGGLLRGEAMLAGFIALAPEEEGKKHLDLLLRDARPRLRAPLRRVRGLVQVHAGHLRSLLPVDRGAPVHGQRAGCRHARGRRRAGRPGGDHVPGHDPRRLARSHHAARRRRSHSPTHVGTAPEAIRCELVDAGHLGLFMSRAALREHWAPLLAELARGG